MVCLFVCSEGSAFTKLCQSVTVMTTVMAMAMADDDANDDDDEVTCDADDKLCKSR